MKIKGYIKFIFPFILLVILAFLQAFSVKRNFNKKVSKPEIEFVAGENHFLTHAMVNKLLIQNYDSIQNTPKRVLDLQGLKETVLKNPYVEKAIVFTTVSGEFKTIIKQREPIARIVEKEKSYYIDKEGVTVPLSDNFSSRVPLISGVKSAQDIKEITHLVTKILADNFLKKEIIGIDKKANNEYVFDVRSGAYKIEFGNFSEPEVKFKKLKAFYNKAYADKTIESYQKINLKYHNQVVCTK